MTSDLTHEKQQLHELVDRLAPSQVSAVRGLLQVMLDPVSRAIANAPVDDEPLTAEEAHAFNEAREWLKHNEPIPHERVPRLVNKRGGDPERALAFLRTLRHLVELIGSDVYGEFEAEARERLGQRDPDDWPILAAALALRCPIWTEDTDFFGCGVATWTSNRVRVFLRE
jgi:hypothetical protein